MPSGKSKNKFYHSVGKRIVDVVLTAPALIVLSPIFVVVALLVRIRLGSPVLFKQIRPGLHGKPFSIFKFRTMTDAHDTEGTWFPTPSFSPWAAGSPC